MSKANVEKWTENINSFAESKKVGACPYCNSNRTTHGYQKVTKDGYGFGVIWCKACKHGFLIDRVNLKQIEDLGEPIPKDIIY